MRHAFAVWAEFSIKNLLRSAHKLNHAALIEKTFIVSVGRGHSKAVDSVHDALICSEIHCVLRISRRLHNYTQDFGEHFTRTINSAPWGHFAIDRPPPRASASA